MLGISLCFANDAQVHRIHSLSLQRRGSNDLGISKEIWCRIHVINFNDLGIFKEIW